MAKKQINLSGTNNKTYDLDKISTQNTRLDSQMALITEIWYWNPDSSDKDHKFPNPPKPEVGRIWLSKMVPLDELNEHIGGDK